jgi:hypothetical protein
LAKNGQSNVSAVKNIFSVKVCDVKTEYLFRFVMTEILFSIVRKLTAIHIETCNTSRVPNRCRQLAILVLTLPHLGEVLSAPYSRLHAVLLSKSLLLQILLGTLILG